jgi:2-dehydropantoate 2-reductase
MKIVVVGAGATGAALGGYLALAGETVCFLDPFEEHMTACRENGLTIKAASFLSVNDVHEYKVRVNATTKAAEAGIADVVLFMPKGIHSRDAMPNALAVSDEHTVLLTMQNGLGNVEIISEYFDPARISCGITSISSGLPEPGVVTPRIPAHNQIWIGAENKSLEPLLQTLAEDFRKIGLEAAYDEDIITRIWEKFAMNCGVNAATSILRLTARNAAQFQDYIDIRQKVIREVDAIAKKRGIYMNPRTIFGLGDKAVPKEQSKSPDTYASMAQDAKGKRPTEIMSLNGYAAAEARRLGVAAPYNEVLTKLVCVIEQAYELQF